METQATKSTKRGAKPRTQDGILAAGAVASSVASTVQTLVRWGCGTWIAYYAFRAIEVLAGKETQANVVLNFLGNLNVSSTVAWGAGAVGVAYGWRQKRLRGTNIERMSTYQKKLEAMVDPNRSSSNLTPRGETNPEDKP